MQARSTQRVGGKRRTGGSPPRARGRPPGSVSLTKEIEATILNYIRAGAFAYVAAEAAGISERTFHDWIARGEGRHPTRAPTPRLRAFAQAVGKAQAEARLAAEARVYRDQPGYWLSRVARTRPDREGWTAPQKGSGEDESTPAPGADLTKLTDEELLRSIDQLHRATLRDGGTISSYPCPHPRCRCPWHDAWREERRNLRD